MILCYRCIECLLKILFIAIAGASGIEEDLSAIFNDCHDDEFYSSGDDMEQVSDCRLICTLSSY